MLTLVMWPEYWSASVMDEMVMEESKVDATRKDFFMSTASAFGK